MEDFKKKYDDLVLEYKADRICRDHHVKSLESQIKTLQEKIKALENNTQKVDPFVSWRAR